MALVFRAHFYTIVDGKNRHYSPGDRPDFEGAKLDRLVRRGALAEEGVPAAPVEVAPVVEEPVDDDQEPNRPRKTAKVEVWQSYARAKGVDPSGLSKQELIAKLG